jgi:hypothetical protein
MYRPSYPQMNAPMAYGMNPNMSNMRMSVPQTTMMNAPSPY